MPTWDESGYLHYKLKYGDFEVNPIDRVVVTRFEDGTSVTAAPEDTPEYLAQAKAIGYDYIYPDEAGQMWHMCRDHEWLHSHLAEAQGELFSNVLMAKAHGWKLLPGQAEKEEALVLEVQRLLNKMMYAGNMHRVMEDYNG